MGFRIIVATAFALASAGAASAGSASDRLVDRFEARLDHQGSRIDAGVGAGRIGPRESQALGRQQASLGRALERQAADGNGLNLREAHRLDNRFDRGSRAIRVAGRRG